MSSEEKQMLPIEERDEFVAPRTIFKIVLSAYRILLLLVQQYKKLERARNPRTTFKFLLALPLTITFILYFRIGDTLVGWLFANYLILLPSWPAVKRAIIIPEKITQIMTTVK